MTQSNQNSTTVSSDEVIVAGSRAHSYVVGTQPNAANSYCNETQVSPIQSGDTMPSLKREGEQQGIQQEIVETADSAHQQDGAIKQMTLDDLKTDDMPSSQRIVIIASIICIIGAIVYYFAMMR